MAMTHPTLLVLETDRFQLFIKICEAPENVVEQFNTVLRGLCLLAHCEREERNHSHEVIQKVSACTKDVVSMCAF
jgi:hypothetical protein